MTGDDKVIRLERQYSASAADVFDAIKKGVLFISCGFKKESMKMDFKVGGNYSLKYGENKELSGEFLEIVPHSKIVFTWGEAGCVTIGLESRGNGTTLRLTHEDIPTEELFKGITNGWTGGLDAFQGEF